MKAGTADQAQTLDHYLAVPVHALRLDEVADFALYIYSAKTDQHVLYRSANLPFTGEALERLNSHGVAELYVSREESPALTRYLEAHLGDLLSDDRLEVEQRSSIMYESARNLVQEAMEDPRSGKLIERSSDMVGHMVKFIFEEGRSFESLMKVCSYDYYTYTHSVNVFTYCMALAEHLGMAQQDVHAFGQGALLHDIGKSKLPLDVINSPGKLTDEQWELMRLHPVYGYELLQEQGVTDPVVLDVTRHHHEKLNGRGYPDQLSSDEISRWSRMCTIVDIFDALTTRRSYKDARHSFESLQFMRTHMSDELDPHLFKAFIGMMGQKAQ